MHLFIDTNILLSFYSLSSDDLEELRKLTVLIDKKLLKLHISDQLLDEFNRNRDSKIKEALERFRQEKLNDQFPQICKEYPEYKKMRDAIKLFQESKSQLIENLSQDIQDEKLKADKIIKELFRKSQKTSIDDEIYLTAERRMKCGNPPGKKGSLGDAINWESLLNSVPDNEDIYFVTDDSDYFGEIDENDIDPFLRYEWLQKKNSNIHFYKRLSAFFKDKFPDIKLATELEKELLIQQLANSPSFADTRSILNKLIKFDDYTITQVNDIIEASISNNQVYWIITDLDIKKYLKSIVAGKENKIDNRNYKIFLSLLNGDSRSQAEVDADIPAF